MSEDETDDAPGFGDEETQPIRMRRHRRRSGWLMRKLRTHVQWLFTKCPFGKHHWRWERICLCGFGVTEEIEGWHGGLWDLKHETEYQFCAGAECFGAYSSDTHFWHLSNEEEALVRAWRYYRSTRIDPLSSTRQVDYGVFVHMNGKSEWLVRGARLSTADPGEDLETLFVTPTDSEPN